MTERMTVICTGINGEKTEVPVDQLTFRPSVFAVIIKNNEVLLSSQWDGWDFPGGGMHLEESIDRALTREVHQETGLIIQRDKLLHVTDHFFTHPNGDRHFHSVLMYFTCKGLEGVLKTQGLNKGERAYVRDAQWIPLNHVPELKFYNQVDSPLLIRMAAEGRGI